MPDLFFGGNFYDWDELKIAGIVDNGDRVRIEVQVYMVNDEMVPSYRLIERDSPESDDLWSQNLVVFASSPFLRPTTDSTISNLSVEEPDFYGSRRFVSSFQALSTWIEGSVDFGAVLGHQSKDNCYICGLWTVQESHPPIRLWQMDAASGVVVEFLPSNSNTNTGDLIIRRL